MRKLQTPEEKEKREKTTKAILGIALMALLLLSTAGYAFYGSEKTEDKTNEPYFDGNYWIYPVSGTYLSLSTEPQKLQEALGLFRLPQGYAPSSSFYLATNPETRNYMSGNLGQFFNVINACYGSCEEDLPEKDCSEPMIIYTTSDSNRVSINESCLLIEGSQEYLDAFIYSFSGR